MGLRAGEWELDRPLGSGGMAEVFAARTQTGATAAVKLLRKELAGDPEVLARFWREARVAAQIGHPGIVRLFGNGEAEDGRPYIAMELLEGQTLDELRKEPGGVPLDRLLGLVDQLLDVLQAAHARGVVHRDLKPANLFVTRTGQLKVLDFGIARVLEAAADDVRTATGLAIGTVTYMAPEQAAGMRDQIDARTDLFGVGAILFRVLSGKRLHEATGTAQMLLMMASTPARSLASVAPGVSAPIVAVVDRALAFDKRARFASAREMQEALRAAQAPASNTATTVSAGQHGAADAPTAVLSQRRAEPTPATPAVSAMQRATLWVLLPVVFVLGALLVLGTSAAISVGMLSAPVAGEPEAPVTGVEHASDQEQYQQVPLEKLREGSKGGEDGPFFHKNIVTTGVVRSVHDEPGFHRVVLGEGDSPWVACLSGKPVNVAVGAQITVRGQVMAFDGGAKQIPISGCERLK